MSATRTALVQMFDSTVVSAGFVGWQGGAEKTVQQASEGLYYHYRIEGSSSFFRGVQIIKPKRTAQEYGAYLEMLEKQPKQYESFITVDWKNKRIATVSCRPDAIASYFEKDSPLPFHISPVFFNAAVLDKYKADPEKYSLDQRSISCRNSWHLQSYDVNDAGQVHTYIKYLGDLPYTEQVYWKSFNEPPKGGISERAYTTDFEGNFDTSPDSLRDLKRLVSELDRAGVQWYTLREAELIEQLHYPLTSSAKAWGDVLSTLAKIVVEGLQRRFFETTARRRGSEGDVKWGSIRWAREALSLSGVGESAVLEAIEPLSELQNLRTQFSGAHSRGAEAAKLRAGLLRKYKSPRGHIEHLCAQLVTSLGVLRAAFPSDAGQAPR
jgi:hypothetical protein